MIAALLSVSFLLAAETPPAVASQGSVQDLGFAKSLYAEGDYYRAITEAKRALFVDPANGEARLLIGQSYLAGEQWAAAAAALETLVRESPQGKVGADASFALAEARFGSGDFDLAALEYSRFSEDWTEDARKPAADLRMAWARLYAADAIATRHPEKGKIAFAAIAKQLSAIPDDHPEKARAKQLADGATKLSTMGRRSPFLAGTMSTVVPGLGQVYAGRYADGLIAFVVNGLFLYSIYETFDRRPVVADNPVGIMLVLFESGWYTGNIYSAVNSAHRSNNERRSAVLRDLRKNLWVQAAPHRDGAVAYLGGSF